MLQSLKFLPAGVPVYSLAPAGPARLRWAVWSDRRHVETKKPIAAGFAATEEQAMACIRGVAPNAARALGCFAGGANVCKFVDPEDAVLSNIIDLLPRLKQRAAEPDEREAR